MACVDAPPSSLYLSYLDAEPPPGFLLLFFLPLSPAPLKLLHVATGAGPFGPRRPHFRTGKTFQGGQRPKMGMRNDSGVCFAFVLFSPVLPRSVWWVINQLLRWAGTWQCITGRGSRGGGDPADGFRGVATVTRSHIQKTTEIIFISYF